MADAPLGRRLLWFVALWAAGVVSFEEAVKILQVRGKAMQDACTERPGGMVSVMGLPMAELVKVCEAAGVQMANINSTEQIVLSGDKDKIGEAEKLAHLVADVLDATEDLAVTTYVKSEVAKLTAAFPVYGK